MPIDFTFVLACKPSALDTLFARVELLLLPSDFVRSDEVLVSNSDEEPDSADEETLLINDLSEEGGRLRGWRSIYMEFQSEGVALALQFDLTSSDTMTGLIFVPMNAMYRLHRDAIPSEFYDAIGLIAAASEATGGFGGFEAGQTTAPPVQVLTDLMEDPANRERWFSIHILPSTAAASVEGLWRRDFELIRKEGFSFFIKRDFLALCSQFGK